MSKIELQKVRAEGKPVELVFDPNWYKANYGLPLELSDEEADAHYRTKGEAAGHQPNPYFMPNFVQAQLQRLGHKRSGDLRADFLAAAASVDPHVLLPRTPVLFSAAAPVDASVRSEWYNFSVYLLRFLDTQDTRHSLFFDPSFIRDESGQLAASPLRYFLENMSHTDQQTSVLFDPEFYAATYPGVRFASNEQKNFSSLFHHFIQEGMRQNKLPFADLDLEYYQKQNPDVQEAVDQGVLSWVEHFLHFGLREGRNPNPFFNARYYLEAQPDVAASIRRHKLSGPLEHFLKFGYKAGYKANQPLYSIDVPDFHGKSLYEQRCNVATTSVLRAGKPIAFPKLEEKPKLSCIIPVVNQGPMTVHLLQQLAGIAWRRDMPSLEVVVVDNGSTDITTQLPELTENVTVLRSPTALGYPKACNMGAAAATGEVLLFMNNDIEVNAESLKKGIEDLEKDPDIGAVGGRIILTNGKLQEAGSILFNDASALGFGRDGHPDFPQFNVAREVDYCSGCFLFVRRSDFESIDGFDEVFSPGYYEEADLCFRLKEVGLASYFDPEIYIYHYEYASYSKGRPPAVSAALMRRNQKTFRARHRKRLSRAPMREGSRWQGLVAAQRDKTAKTVAVVEDFMPDRSMGSGFVRAADLIETFLDEGYRVTLFVMNYKFSTAGEYLRQRGVEIVNLYESGYSDSPLSGREWDFDTVWICRTHNFSRWADWVRAAQIVNHDIRMVFDTEAIASLREVEYRKLHNLRQPENIRLMVASELDSPLAPNGIVTVNNIDREAVEDLSIAPVFELGHRMNNREDAPGLKGRKGFFFCGSFHSLDSPNYDSIDWFLTHVWPEIRSEHPEATLTIAGYCGDDVPLEERLAGCEGVDYAGRVDDLQTYFDQARCFIAPTRFAGGIPHKVHEALAAGVPTICSTVLHRQLATESYPAESVPVCSADVSDPQAFAAQCCALLTDDKLWSGLQKAGYTYIHDTASEKIFRSQIRTIMNAL